MPAPLPDDTRGIVDPQEMMRHVDFARHPAGEVLDGLVEWFWSVAWSLPDGTVHDQQVLNHPAGNISIGTLDDAGVTLDPAEGRVYGVMSSVSHRRLSSTGWTVAARTSVGGLGVLLDAPARSAADAQLDFPTGLPGLAPGVVRSVSDLGDNEARADALRRALEALVARRDPAMVSEAREVARVAGLAEHDRSVCRVEQLAAEAGVSVRTLQRLFDHHVGAGPSFVIRRWRIIEAAEAARAAVDSNDSWRGWAAVAAELGYSDQAHLTRDFRRDLGTSPSAYLAQTSRVPGRRPGDHQSTPQEITRSG
ncbi:MAG: helix-turn-helix transcriptional regulator [Microthrixaceae bacterium]